ncbi:hypothetical protein L228DRAFT_31229 [Xylona heveae TC161]|uniref:Uncharacterized protein n=1 Tax=Xylona heveae (strain CBS 132557 / TC161) TaxID=1328760 RepID=A0A165A3Q9_XYLHT|nr:hypothetical protein L228DRAFT_31229 [Xylona heveae TC161]KZF19907.1 hypothetical protein L228DRAFT_31229 [Xylona heveae TC161]
MLRHNSQHALLLFLCAMLAINLHILLRIIFPITAMYKTHKSAWWAALIASIAVNAVWVKTYLYISEANGLNVPVNVVVTVVTPYLAGWLHEYIATKGVVSNCSSFRRAVVCNDQ